MYAIRSYYVPSHVRSGLERPGGRLGTPEVARQCGLAYIYSAASKVALAANAAIDRLLPVLGVLV